MLLKLLGTAAGGGLPQWNCGCAQCVAARAGAPEVPARTQSSVAVSADGARWVLLNVSPDVRTQLERSPELAPAKGSLRGSPVAAVALTNADLDHTAGLLVLREGGAPPVYCTGRVRDALTRGLRLLPVLEAYGPVQVRPLEPDATVRFAARDGSSLGLRADVLAVVSKPPPYMLAHLSAAEAADDLAGDTVGLRLWDEATGRCAAYLPGVRELDARVRAFVEPADVVLLDGTTFTDEELVTLGASTRTARMMGHAPLSGPGGSLEFVRSLRPGVRVVFVHVNNTNPVLRAGSPERGALEASGARLGSDGETLAV